MVMAEPNPFEELIERLALILIFAIFGIIFLVAAAIIVISSPISVAGAVISAWVIWAAYKGKLF
jgi:hypothetical protein